MKLVEIDYQLELDFKGKNTLNPEAFRNLIMKC